MSGPSQSKPSEHALLSSIQSNLKAFLALQTRATTNLKNINVLQGNLTAETEPFAIIRPKLERAYNVARNEIAEEEKILQEILEALANIINLRSNAAQAATAEPALPNQEKRKKRRIDAGSPTPSADGSVTAAPRNPRRASPATTVPPQPRPAQSASVVPPTARPSSSKPPAVSREGSAVATSQPNKGAAVVRKVGKGGTLAEGRHVAFRPPKAGQGEREGWILTKVLRHLSGDKLEVQDIEDEENGSPGAIYPTTLKAIVPLPDPNDKSTFPTIGYPASSEVMALYPDTTTFYHAKVVASLTMQKNKPTYKVIFDDDGENIRSVVAEHVALWPK